MMHFYGFCFLIINQYALSRAEELMTLFLFLSGERVSGRKKVGVISRTPILLRLNEVLLD